MLFDDFTERLIEPDQPVRQGQLRIGTDLPVGDMTETIALGPDHAPACAAKARIEADNDQASRSITSSETS
jgi:hypothetical protein